MRKLFGIIGIYEMSKEATSEKEEIEKEKKCELK